MTALCAVCKEDRVTLLTDGACVEAGGRLAMVAPKVFTFPHLSAALAVVGPTAMILRLGAMLSVSATFDDLLGEAPGMARIAYCELGEMNDFGEGGRDFELYLAGYSPTRDRMEGWRLIGHDRSSDVRPWELNAAPDIIVTPLPPDYTWPEDFDPLTDGLELIEAQRRVGGPLGFVIGGFAQVTTIKRDAIETMIIRRWPDEVGKTINPTEVL